MSDNTMNAVYRKEFGKGAARKLRAAGHIPAVIYGHGENPTHVALPGHETALLIRRANAVIDLSIEGEKKLVLVKDVQRDPVRQAIEHLDLVVVRKGEKVTVDIAVHIEGESFSGTMVQVEHQSVSVEAEATHIPESITVSVEGLHEGTQIHARDLQMPAGTTLLSDPDMLILHITLPAKADDSATGAEGTAAAAPAASQEAVEEAPSEAAPAESEE